MCSLSDGISTFSGRLSRIVCPTMGLSGNNVLVVFVMTLQLRATSIFRLLVDNT
jgi:hypothetical protein